MFIGVCGSSSSGKTTISELLKAAHIIIQTESTTAIEAYIYNKIVFSY